MCEHMNFEAYTKVIRLTDGDDGPVNGYRAELFINCLECGLPFEFIGVEGGYNNNFPTVNLNSTELRIPIKPSTEKPDLELLKSKNN